MLFSVILFLGACTLLSNQKDILLPFSTDFKSADGWSLDAGARFDASVSATAGSGSIRLEKSGNNWVTSDRITSDFRLPVKAGMSYTLSFKSKSNTFPPPLLEVYGAMLGDSGVIENSNGTKCTNAQKSVWEENYVVIRIPKNSAIKYFKIKILMMPKESISAPVWIDDLKFEEGVHLPHALPKKTFSGKNIRIDKLGNIEIKKGAQLIPFFPIGIYTDENRADWRIYKKMGFNLNMWASDAASIAKSKRVGLYSMMQIVQYIVPVGEDWIPQNPEKKSAHLKKTIGQIRSEGLWDNLLFYYVDNEFYHLKRSFTDTIDQVRMLDRGSHPIYMLSGAYGMARMYNRYIDFTGTYVAEDGYETPIVENLRVLDTTPDQKQPVVFAQINRGVGKNFRAVVYGALAEGARGIGFWRDGGSAGRIEKRPIYKQLPKISKEIQKMLPLLRTPTETAWQLHCDNHSLITGTRTLHNEGYVIIANPTSIRQQTNCKIEELPYHAKLVKTYIGDQIEAKIDHNSFSLTMEPYDAKVIRLAQ